VGLSWPGTYRCDCCDRDGGTREFGTTRPQGLVIHRYRLVGTQSVSRADEAGVRASLQSLKTIGLADPPDGE
jgi:hypothetical protein